MNDDLTPRRREILEAAVLVLAGAGSRGLTHRAVDRQAGLAEGSTSAYFRSRDALQVALADFVAHRLSSDVERLGEQLATVAPQPGHLTAAAVALFSRWLEHPAFLTARLELTVAATRDPELARRFLAWRRDLVRIVADLLEARRGDSNRERVVVPSAETLVAALDGVLLAALLQPAQQRLAFASQSVDQLLSGVDDDR